MSLQTCAVRVRLYTQDGAPDVGATVVATLNRFEAAEGYIGPLEVTVETDANGVAILNLWPNALGSTESVYKIRIAGSEGRINLTATVPNTPACDLEDIATLPPYPGKKDGELAVEQAVQHAAIATDQAIIATAKAAEAAESAETAVERAESATDSAAAAAASEAMALAARPVTSLTPPANPLPNTEWIDQATGIHYTWLQDANGYQWVETYVAQVVDNPTLVGELETSLGAEDGAGMVGFKQGTAGKERKVKDKLKERITVSDFAHLAVEVSAKTPGDVASRVAETFIDWRPAIQAALDEAFNRGGATVIIDGAGPLPISDYVAVHAKTTAIWEVPIKLYDYTTIGGMVVTDGDDISLFSPKLDGSGIYAGGSGQNGIGSLNGTGDVYIYNPTIVGCERGGYGPRDGGKAFQFESTHGTINIYGPKTRNCAMGLSVQHDFTETEASGPVIVHGLSTENCGIDIFVRQVGGYDSTGQDHLLVVTGYVSKNSGTNGGAIQLSRGAQVHIEGVITTDAKIDAIIRGNHANSSFDLKVSGDCGAHVNLDPSEYALDSSYPCKGNSYHIQHTHGTADYVLWADEETPFRTLPDCKVDVVLANDVAIKIAGDELRNGYCAIELQQGGRSITTTTATLYVESKAKVADFPAGATIIGLNTGQKGDWTPVDQSGAGLVFATANGKYAKLDTATFCPFRVTFPVTASNAPTLIGGLPHASINDAFKIVDGFAFRYTDAAKQITAISVAGTNTFRLADNTGAILTNSDMSGKTLDGMIIMFT